MLSFIAALAAVAGLFGWALLLSARAGRGLGATLLPVLAAALLTLNVGLIVGVPLAARLVIVGGGLAALVFVLVRDHRTALGQLATPGSVLVIAGVALLAIGNGPALFVEWDEFSHWGKVAKYIAIAGTYPTPESYAGFLDYPFGLAAFQGLFLWPGSFSEPMTMTAHGFLALACLAALLERTGWRDWPIAVALAGIFVVGRYFFHDHPWSSILPDTLIGLTAGAAAAIYWRGDGDWKGILLAAPVVLALPFFKDIGQFLALILLVFMGLDQMIRFAAGRPAWREAGAIAALALLFLGVKAFWAGHVDAIGAATSFARSGPDLLARLATAEFGPNTARVIETFFDNIVSTRIGLRRAPTVPVWLGANAVIAALAAALSGSRQAAVRIVFANLAIAIGFAVYAAGLLALYVFSFSVYEGTRAASFARYMGTYVVFWTTVNLVFLANPPFRTLSRRVVAVATLVILMVMTVRLAGPVARRDIADYVAGTPGGEPVRELRRTVHERLADPPDGSLQLVWTGTEGAEFYIGTFELTPRLVTMPQCFSLGPPRFDRDIWSCDLPPEAVGTLFAARDHLALGRTDDVFWDRYGGLFAEGARDSGAVWFEPGPDGRLRPIPR